MTAGVTYRVRLRFRLQKMLNLDVHEHRLQIEDREVVLSAPLPDEKIKDSEWLIMNTRGLPSEEEAWRFGRKLKVALEVSAIAARVGIDTGQDLPTTTLSGVFREVVTEKSGTLVRDNIHGLDVFLDDPNTRIFSMSLMGVVRTSPDPFLTDLNELVASGTAPSERIEDVILLLNYALMRPEPVAQIVFAVSAVESLGQDETWSPDQRQLLGNLAIMAEQSPTGTDAERKEVADTIRKGMHRISLRQGVFRLLERLGLANLKRAWDDLYSERSTLVHGVAPKPGEKYADLAYRTVSLCGKIILKAVAAEIPLADRHVAKRYYV